VTVERRTIESLAPPPAYAHVAVASGELVFTAGAVPVDSAGKLIGRKDAAAQARQVIANLLVQLAGGGASAADVAKTTVYVVADDPALLSTVWEVVRESPLAGAPSTLLGVSALGYRGQLVEIEAVAVIA
jgi:enamine deaminase RidA (YjgF/YER057c/UK114 family)